MAHWSHQKYHTFAAASEAASLYSFDMSGMTRHAQSAVACVRELHVSGFRLGQACHQGLQLRGVVSVAMLSGSLYETRDVNTLNTARRASRACESRALL